MSKAKTCPDCGASIPYVGRRDLMNALLALFHATDGVDPYSVSAHSALADVQTNVHFDVRNALGFCIEGECAKRNVARVRQAVTDMRWDAEERRQRVTLIMRQREPDGSWEGRCSFRRVDHLQQYAPHRPFSPVMGILNEARAEAEAEQYNGTIRQLKTGAWLVVTADGVFRNLDGPIDPVSLRDAWAEERSPLGTLLDELGEGGTHG